MNVYVYKWGGGKIPPQDIKSNKIVSEENNKTHLKIHRITYLHLRIYLAQLEWYKYRLCSDAHNI